MIDTLFFWKTSSAIPVSKKILFLLRICMGILFLYSGMDKALSGFSAAGYLMKATQGPLQPFFAAMAGNLLVDGLVVFGEIGIGIGLLFGALTRFSAHCGVVMMLLFYLSVLPQPHGPISEHIIYAIVLLLIANSTVGRVIGVDGLLVQQKVFKIPNKLQLFFIG